MISQQEYNLLTRFGQCPFRGLTVREIKDNKFQINNELNTLLARGLVENKSKNKAIISSSLLKINSKGLCALVLYEQSLMQKIQRWWRNWRFV